MTSEQRRVVLTLGFCGLVSAADNWFVSPALPAIAQTLAVAPSVVAVILTAYLVPYGALQPVCGAIGDRVGRVRLLRVIVAGLAVGTLVCALAPSPPALVAARILTGCFAAGIISVSQALVGDVVLAEDRAAAVGLLMGVTFTGQGLSAGLGGIITELVGWRAAFVCFGVLAVVAWLGVMRLRGVGEREADGSGSRSGVGAFLSSAVRIFFGPGRAVFLIAFTTGIIYLGVYGFMGTFLAERCGLSSTPAGLLMMFYGLACLAGGSLSGRIGGWRGLRGTILVGEASGLAAAGLLLVSTVTGSWVPALVAAACLGLGYILVQPTLVSLSMDVDPAQTGLCTGLIGFGVFVGGGVGSTLGGFAISAGGYEALWVAAAVALALQTAIGWRVLALEGSRTRARGPLYLLLGPDELAAAGLAAVDEQVLAGHETVGDGHEVDPLRNLLRRGPTAHRCEVHDAPPELGVVHDALVERGENAAGVDAVARTLRGEAPGHVLGVGDDAALGRGVLGKLAAGMPAGGPHVDHGAHLRGGLCQKD